MWLFARTGAKKGALVKFRSLQQICILDMAVTCCRAVSPADFGAAIPARTEASTQRALELVKTQPCEHQAAGSAWGPSDASRDVPCPTGALLSNGFVGGSEQAVKY